MAPGGPTVPSPSSASGLLCDVGQVTPLLWPEQHVAELAVQHSPYLAALAAALAAAAGDTAPGETEGRTNDTRPTYPFTHAYPHLPI